MKNKTLMKTLSALLAVVMVVLVAPLSGVVGLKFPEIKFSNLLDFSIKAEAEVMSGSCGATSSDNVHWSIVNGVLNITGTGDMKNYSYSSTPWSTWGNHIDSLNIGDGVTSIGEYSFSSMSFDYVKIPKSVKNINKYAFGDSNSFRYIIYSGSKDDWNKILIEDNNENFKNSTVFYQTTPLEFKFDKGIEYIIGNEYAIVNLYTGSDENVIILQEIEGKPVVGIAPSAFRENDTIVSVTIPDSIEYIGEYAFFKCVNLKTVTLGDNVTSIHFLAFGYCTKLEYVTIPDSMVSIKNHAFDECSSLKYVVYSGSKDDWNNMFIGQNNVALMDATLFYQTETLKFKEENGIVYSITDTSAAVDFYTGTEPEITILSEIEGKPVTEINKNAFRKNTVLTSVIIPDSVVSILDSAFSFCENLAEIDIPDSISYIGDGVFYGCSSLEKVRLPENLNYLGECTFFDCINLSEIIVECANIETIEGYPFYGCGVETNGINVVFTEKVRTIPNEMFAVLDDWLWDMEAEVGEVFLDSSNLKSVTIGKNVAYIGESAFFNNENIVELNFNATNCTFANRVFSSCSSLTDVNIGDGVEKIPEYFISDCKGVTNVDIPESSRSIGDNAFSGCSSMCEVTIPKSVTSIGNNAFSGCSSITELIIPESVTEIGEYAFSNCENLENVVFLGKDGIYIGDNIFDYSPKATICCKENSYMHSYADTNVIRYCIIDEANNPNYEIKNEVLILYTGYEESLYLNFVSRVGYGAFGGNTLMKQIELSSCIDRIYDRAFTECKNLETIIIPKSVTSIGNNAFYGCDKLTIYCYAGSYAETYAKEQGIKYEYITLDLTESKVEIYSDEVFNLGTSYNIDIVDLEEVLWISGDESVVQVAQNGKITAVGEGTAIIIAKTESGLEAECTVTVNAGKRPIVEGVTVSDFSVNYKGTTKIEPDVKYAGAVDYKVEYSSSNESVATVDKDGNVTATGTGEAEITVTITDEYGNVVEDICKVTVSYAWWQWLIIIFLFGWIWY